MADEPQDDMTPEEPTEEASEEQSGSSDGAEAPSGETEGSPESAVDAAESGGVAGGDEAVGDPDAEKAAEEAMLRALETDGDGEEGGADADVKMPDMDFAGGTASVDTAGQAAEAHLAELPDFGTPVDSTVTGEKRNIDLLLDVHLPIAIELGRTQLQISDILELGPGSIVELERLAGEPVDLLVNNRVIAKGEVVVIDENFGLRITSLLSPQDRLKSL